VGIHIAPTQQWTSSRKAGTACPFHGFDFAPDKKVCPEQAALQIVQTQVI
jgi:hypothetical protein